ncbi:MAG: aminoacyl-tRNA hydrolase [Steroidobacteraceae bacterium]
MPGTPLHMIVGLGNPGAEHLQTRHNAGFWFVDALAQKYSGQFRGHTRYQGEVCRIQIGAQEVQLLKPTTYMNRSGLSIRALSDYLKIAPEQILVAHDELDLLPGVARFKLGGGHGGHNGLRDTITHVGQNFWRLRLGIGHPGDRSEVIDFVLQRASAKEEDLIVTALQAALEQVPVFLEQGAEKAMHALHSQSGKSA